MLQVQSAREEGSISSFGLQWQPNENSQERKNFFVHTKFGTLKTKHGINIFIVFVTVVTTVYCYFRLLLHNSNNNKNLSEDCQRTEIKSSNIRVALIFVLKNNFYTVRERKRNVVFGRKRKMPSQSGENYKTIYSRASIIEKKRLKATRICDMK